jgi:hypothetical protein
MRECDIHFAKILELVENAETACTEQSYDEAIEYLEDLREAVEVCIEDLESLELEEEED